MDFVDHIRRFYKDHLPVSAIEKNYLKAPCPFCSHSESGQAGTLVVYLNPDSFFCRFFSVLKPMSAGGISNTLCSFDGYRTQPSARL